MLIRKCIDWYLKHRNPINYAKKLGVTIGENCRLNGSPNWGSEPWIISLGNHTEISFGCTFITHDGATWVFREKEEYKGVVRFGKITIGDNCFIGANSTILPGVHIGDNCIIGACSLVTKSVPHGEVGGVPAHFITTTDKFASKCLEQTPDYDVAEFATNKKSAVKKMVGWSKGEK